MCISAPVAHPHDTWRAMREALDALSKNLPWEFQRGGRTDDQQYTLTNNPGAPFAIYFHAL